MSDSLKHIHTHTQTFSQSVGLDSISINSRTLKIRTNMTYSTALFYNFLKPLINL